LSEVSVAKNRPVSKKGLVEVFTGDGKGKTSAALGAAVRAHGEGLKVYIAFFMKADYPYGEYKALDRMPNVTHVSFGQREFIDPVNIKPAEIEQAGRALAAAREAVMSRNYDLVILDEVNLAAAWKLVKLEDVLRLIKDKPEHVELILTGRKADNQLIEAADLATEMTKIKHPYDAGITARKGIDF
jgi:cob(I)alamin adenosyltransferase